MPNASQGWTWISWGSLSVVHNLTTGFSTFHCSWETCALFRKPNYRRSSSIWGLVFNLLSFPSPFFSVIVTKPEKLCENPLWYRIHTFLTGPQPTCRIARSSVVWIPRMWVSQLLTAARKQAGAGSSTPAD